MAPTSSIIKGNRRFIMRAEDIPRKSMDDSVLSPFPCSFKTGYRKVLDSGVMALRLWP